MFKIKYINWQEFEELNERLKDKLKNEKFDSIICINRGGLVIGRILSDKLNLPLGVITIKAYKNGKKELLEKPVMDTKISTVTGVKGSVLLVDDLSDSGKTLQLAFDYLNKNDNITEIKTAILFHKKEACFNPDYYVENKEDWIVFPYEKEEFKNG